MGDDGRSGQMGLSCPSSETDAGVLSEKVVAGVAMNSGSMFKASHEGGDCFYSSGWDPMVSLSQTENFGTPSMVAHGMFASPSYPITSEIGGGNFSEMVSSFGVPGYGQNYTGICPEKYASNKNMVIEKASTGLTPSPNGKKKRLSGSSSPSDPKKADEGDQDRDLSGETVEPKESDEKKRRMEQTGKQVRDISHNGEEPKDNYIHVRARRGQATNSHSLAERVRREKISQRMRLLQELVPGCNKITGKAVMLDEIINYVQSLQQQVEFLSMKLATVNPELNFDIDRILSKDILHLRGGVPPVLGFNTGPSSSNPYAPGIHQGALPGVSTAPAYHPVPQGMWDSEMQGMYHMGFDSNAGVVNLGPNGSSKPEAR